MCESESRSVLSNSLWPHGLYSLWNSPGQNTGVGSLSLLQGIFPIQGSNPGLLYCRQILYQLSHKGCITNLLFYILETKTTLWTTLLLYTHTHTHTHIYNGSIQINPHPFPGELLDIYQHTTDLTYDFSPICKILTNKYIPCVFNTCFYLSVCSVVCETSFWTN